MLKPDTIIIMVCNLGFIIITDINECLVAALDIFAADLCEPSMFCVNSVGSYSCECLAGTLLVDGVCQAGECISRVCV